MVIRGHTLFLDANCSTAHATIKKLKIKKSKKLNTSKGHRLVPILNGLKPLRRSS